MIWMWKRRSDETGMEIYMVQELELGRATLNYDYGRQLRDIHSRRSLRLNPYRCRRQESAAYVF